MALKIKNWSKLLIHSANMKAFQLKSPANLWYSKPECLIFAAVQMFAISEVNLVSLEANPAGTSWL